MIRKKFIFSIGILTALTCMLMYVPSFAEDDVQELKQQIEQLQKRVDELESQKMDQKSDPWGLFNQGGNRNWDPFEEMHRMQNEMDRMFQNSFSSMGNPKQGMFSSSMSFDYDFDMKENNDEYVITFNMKGLDQDKIDIDINEHSITVRGEQSREDTEEHQDTYFSSKSYGSFMKTIPLPVDADTSKAKTEKKGDDLVITLPKKA